MEGVEVGLRSGKVLGNLLEKGAIKCEQLLWSDNWQLKFKNLNLNLML